MRPDGTACADVANAPLLAWTDGPAASVDHMRSIFEPLRTSWDSLAGSVHVYALPGWDAAVVQPWHDAISRTGVCVVQPVPFLHATVQRTPVFLPTPRPGALDRFATALTSIARGRAAFAVPLRRPAVMSTAVCATGDRTPEWHAIVTEIRAASAAAFPGRPMPAGPHAPHVSLGYARAEADDAPLASAFAALDNVPWTGSLAVGALHLLSVDADEDAGTFTWTSLSVHPLR